MKTRTDSLLVVCLLLCEHCWFISASTNHTNEFDEVYKNISFLLDNAADGYDKRLPPNYGKDSHCVEVFVNLFVSSMSSVSEINMDYSMTLLIRERWIDERLTYNDTLNLTRLEMDGSFINQIWKPDVYIINEKMSEIHLVTVPNQLVHIYPNGTVQISMRVSGSFDCSMNLLTYPFDTQVCNLDFMSYAHSTEQLLFRWTDDALRVANGITFPQFTLTNSSQYNCNKWYYGIEFPCVGVKFILERQYSYYIIQLYVPSILIVVLSWVSFWLDADAVPARITIGLMTVLTMETQCSSAHETLPPVSTIKAIDVWMAVCIAFVFLALVEFAYVNVQSRVYSRRQREKIIRLSANIKKTVHFDSSQLNMNVDQENTICCFKQAPALGRARMIDKVSRVVFPVSFLLFNVGYWTLYFNWKPGKSF